MKKIIYKLKIPNTKLREPRFKDLQNISYSATQVCLWVLLLFVVVSSIPTTFAMESDNFSENKLIYGKNTAMYAVKVYTEQLEKAIILHDFPNAELYAKALAKLVMTGNVKRQSQPTYKGVELPGIQAKNYGIGSKKAKPQEKKDIYKALDALASVPTLQLWWTRNGLSEDKSFDVSKFMRSYTVGKERKQSSHYNHRLRVYKYYWEKVTKNSTFFGEFSEDYIKVRGSTDLERLFLATTPSSDPRSHPSYPSFSYEDSPYNGIVHVSYPKYLTLSTSILLKPLYSWVNTIYLPRGAEKWISERKKGKNPLIGINIKEEEGKQDFEKIRTPTNYERFRECMRRISMFDSRTSQEMFFLPHRLQTYKYEDFKTPIKFLFALGKYGAVDLLYDPTTLDDEYPVIKIFVADNEKVYLRLWKAAIEALDSREKKFFEEQFRRETNYGRLTTTQRSTIFLILDNQPTMIEEQAVE